MGGAQAQHSFSGHETFPFRYPWLKKGFDAVCADGDVFSRDDAITTLGVGKNMVRSIRHWCLAAGVIEENRKSTDGAVKATEFGKFLLADDGLDPYLEDPSTLWLLHWQIASNRFRSATWFWAFSHYNEPEFSRETLSTSLERWVQTLGGKQIAPSSLKRDVDCFLRTYVSSRHRNGEIAEESLDCPLVELGLVAPFDESHTYQFRRGRQDGLTEAVLIYAVLRFWESFAPNAETLALYDVARQPGSPGRLFKIDESSLMERLEGIESRTDASLVFGDTAGLRQIYRRRRIESATDVLLEAYPENGRRQ